MPHEINPSPSVADPEARVATAPPASRLSVRAVTTDDGFDVLEQAWNDLLNRSEATVFQTYEWQRTWWKYFGEGKQLLILVFERGGTTEGIAPLFITKERLFGIGVATRLQFAGVGLSDYLSVIAAKESEDDVLRSMAGWLASNRRRWDVFDLEDVTESSASFGALPSLLRSLGLPVYRYQGSVCPRFILPADEAALHEQIGSTRSQNLKRRVRRLENNFQSEVRLVRGPEDPVELALEEFSAIHGERWKSQGYPSAFDDPHHLAFHTEVCRKFAGRDWLRIFFLDIDHQPVAVCFGFNFRTTIYMYQSNAHGSSEVMKCSPGLIIRSVAISRGIDEGMKVFDFMRGNESYKYREWGAFDVKNWLIRSSSGTLAGKVRFPLFLVSEFLGKAAHRFRREYYEYRRYRLSERNGEASVPTYAARRVGHLLSMTVGFIVRHLPGGGTPPTGGSTKEKP